MTEANPAFLIRSPLEIRGVLRSIQDQGTLLRMYTGKESLALITTLLEIDDDNVSIVVDNSADDTFNERLVQSDYISFETTLDKVRVVFTSVGAEHCIHDNRPALRLVFPEAMERVQRREYYRVDIPLTVLTVATIVKPDGKTIEAAIKDLSVGGVSLIDDRNILESTAGIIHRSCQLSLPDTGLVTTDLQVRRSHEETLPSGKKIRIIGYQFINLPNPMYITVQQYISRLERMLNARRRGFD